MQPVITSSLINPTASPARQALANPIFNVYLVVDSVNRHGRVHCLHGVASSGHTAYLCGRSAKVRAWTSSSSDFVKASEKVSDAASKITRKLADLIKEVDAEAQQHFGSGEPVPSDSAEEPLAFKVDLLECADAYQCIAEMPGVSRESMQVRPWFIPVLATTSLLLWQRANLTCARHPIAAQGGQRAPIVHLG